MYAPRMRPGIAPVGVRLLRPSGQISNPADTWHPYVVPALATTIPLATPEAMGHSCAEWLAASAELKRTTLAAFFTARHYAASAAFINSEILRLNVECRNTARVALPITHTTTAATTTASTTPTASTTQRPAVVPWKWIAVGVGGVAVLGGITWFVLSRKSGRK